MSALWPKDSAASPPRRGGRGGDCPSQRRRRWGGRCPQRRRHGAAAAAAGTALPSGRHRSNVPSASAAAKGSTWPWGRHLHVGGRRRRRCAQPPAVGSGVDGRAPGRPRAAGRGRQRGWGAGGPARATAGRTTDARGGDTPACADRSRGRGVAAGGRRHGCRRLWVAAASVRACWRVRGAQQAPPPPSTRPGANTPRLSAPPSVAGEGKQGGLAGRGRGRGGAGAPASLTRRRQRH